MAMRINQSVASQVARQGNEESGRRETVVRLGEQTLADVARRLGVSLEALLQANPQIKDARDLKLGQPVTVPEDRGSVVDAGRASAPPAGMTERRDRLGQLSLVAEYQRSRMTSGTASEGAIALSDLGAASKNVTTKFRAKFTEAAQNKDKFHALMRSVYGDGYDVAKAEQIRQKTLRGDTSWMPKIRWVEDGELQGANGAYDRDAGVIYLNKKWAGNPAFAAQVYGEELGHHLDTVLKTRDTKGDEGEMFRRLLYGEKLSAAERRAIRNENDKGVIYVDGKAREVEFWGLSSITKPFKSAAKAVGGAVKKGAEAVGSAVKSGAKAVGGAVKKGATALGGGLAKGIGIIASPIQGLVSLAKLGYKGVLWLAPRIVDVAWGLGDTLEYGLASVFRNVEEAVRDSFRGMGEILKGNFIKGLRMMTKSYFKLTWQLPTDTVLLFGSQILSAHLTLLGLEPKARGLSDGEIADLKKIYADSIDYSRVRVKRGPSLFTIGAPARTIGNTIYINVKDDAEFKQVLAHEMAHVWQYQNGGADYMSESLMAQGKSFVLHLSLKPAYDVEKALRNGMDWDEMNPEQQAHLLEIARELDVMNPNATNFVFDGFNYAPYVPFMREVIEDEVMNGKGAT